MTTATCYAAEAISIVESPPVARCANRSAPPSEAPMPGFESVQIRDDRLIRSHLGHQQHLRIRENRWNHARRIQQAGKTRGHKGSHPEIRHTSRALLTPHCFVLPVCGGGTELLSKAIVDVDHDSGVCVRCS